MLPVNLLLAEENSLLYETCSNCRKVYIRFISVVCALLLFSFILYTPVVLFLAILQQSCYELLL